MSHLNSPLKSSSKSPLEQTLDLDLTWDLDLDLSLTKSLIIIIRIQQRMMDRDPRPDIVVNHVNPGFVDTDMSSHKGTFTVDR